MKYQFHTCDVFTDVRFGGNPLAVVLAADNLSLEQMQKVTTEFNLSETVFVLAPENAGNTARVRIFTPKREMDFAGHPTIGCACLLAGLSRENAGNFEAKILLEENAGLVPVQVRRAGGKMSAQLVSPGVAEITARDLEPSLMAEGLSLEPGDMGFDGHTAQAVTLTGNTRAFVPVKNLEALSRVKVSYPAHEAALNAAGAKSVMIYTRGGVEADTDFSVRMLAPANGIPEDPATGSAVAMLPEQLAELESLEDGTHAWCIEQGYDMGRPSKLYLEADRHEEAFTEVRVAGSVVFVSQGEIEI